MVKKVVVKETITQSTEESSGHNESKPLEPKRTYKRRTVRETGDSPTPGRKLSARQREEMLIENFVGLQHAMTNLSIKFGALSENISSLLAVFEEAARNFAAGGRPDDKDMLKKINSLLEQNKTIAKGLVLMESKLRGRSNEADYTQQPPQQNYTSFDTSRPKPKPLPSI